MKYIIFLLISLTCVASEPRFRFRDCVEITSGFFQGCKGRVESHDAADYGVRVEDCRGEDFYEFFSESDLKLAKGCM